MLDLLFNRKVSNCLTQILPLAYALTYCVCTYVLYGLDRVQHLCPLPSVLLRGVSISTLHQGHSSTPLQYSSVINWVLYPHRLCQAYWVTSWAVGSLG